MKNFKETIVVLLVFVVGVSAQQPQTVLCEDESYFPDLNCSELQNVASCDEIISVLLPTGLPYCAATCGFCTAGSSVTVSPAASGISPESEVETGVDEVEDENEYDDQSEDVVEDIMSSQSLLGIPTPRTVLTPQPIPEEEMELMVEFSPIPTSTLPAIPVPNLVPISEFPTTLTTPTPIEEGQITQQQNLSPAGQLLAPVPQFTNLVVDAIPPVVENPQLLAPDALVAAPMQASLPQPQSPLVTPAAAVPGAAAVPSPVQNYQIPWGNQAASTGYVNPLLPVDQVYVPQSQEGQAAVQSPLLDATDGECTDVAPDGAPFDCQTYNQMQLCASISEEFCQQSCGRCGQSCEDVVPPGASFGCAEYRALNLCFTIGQDYCQESCGRCAGVSSSAPQPQTSAAIIPPPPFASTPPFQSPLSYILPPPSYPFSPPSYTLPPPSYPFSPPQPGYLFPPPPAPLNLQNSSCPTTNSCQCKKSWQYQNSTYAGCFEAQRFCEVNITTCSPGALQSLIPLTRADQIYGYADTCNSNCQDSAAVSFSSPPPPSPIFGGQGSGLANTLLQGLLAPYYQDNYNNYLFTPSTNPYYSSFGGLFTPGTSPSYSNFLYYGPDGPTGGSASTTQFGFGN